MCNSVEKITISKSGKEQGENVGRLPGSQQGTTVALKYTSAHRASGFASTPIKRLH